MQRSRTRKFVLFALVLLVLAFLFAPAALTVGTSDDVASDTATTLAQEEGEEEAAAEEGAVDAEVGGAIALGLVGLILVLLGVVAVVGAVGLGVIGVGYWQSQAGG